MEELAHSPLGPSSSDRWLNCQGSVLATQGLPDENTRYAAEGTFGHSVAQMIRERDVKASTMLGFVSKQGEHEFTLDAKMAEAIQEYVDYVNGIPGDDYNEQRIRYEKYVKAGFGTMDAAKARTRRAHIVDLKLGEGIQVYAQDNSQLKLYALGFYLEYGWLYDLHDFVLTVFQPRLGHVDSFVITVADLLIWAETVVKPAAESAMKPGAPFKAGEWCTHGFCKIRRTCKTRAQAVFGAVSGEMDDIDVAIAATPLVVNTLTNAQVARALRVKKIATGWFKDLETHAIAEIGHGREVGGFKMVEGRSNRALAFDEDKTIDKIQVVLPDFNVNTLYTEPELKSAPQIEELIGKKLFKPATPATERKEAQPAGPLAELIIKPRGAAVLVPPEDPRPSIKVDAATELENLDSFDL